MSLKTRSARNLAIGGLAAVASLGALAAPSMAASTKTLAATCELPFVGPQPTTLAFTTNIPSSATAGQAIQFGDITTTAKFGGDSPLLFQLVNAATVEGQQNSVLTLSAPNLTIPVTVPTTIGTTSVSDTEPTALVGTGSLPLITFPQKATATVTATSVNLTLLARDPSGNPIFLDGESQTFDVPCTINAGQNTTLATIKVKK